MQSACSLTGSEPIRPDEGGNQHALSPAPSPSALMREAISMLSHRLRAHPP